VSRDAGLGTVVVSAPAKINLCLGVGAVRSDGYHALATVYQAIGIYDRVTVRHLRRGHGLEAGADAATVTVRVRSRSRVSAQAVPTDASNIAARAALLLAARCHGRTPSVEITIDKAIPVAGGMAGGSADAAAALVACDALWGLRTPREKLLELAAELGSDVPFALVGGTAAGSGRGEVVAPLATRGEYWWVVLESSRGLSTAEVYRELDAMRAGSPAGPARIPEELARGLDRHAVAAVGAALSNDLQGAALRLRPELGSALELGRHVGAHGAILSGSGPTCLYLCDGRAHASRVADAVRMNGLGPVAVAAGPAPGARVVTRSGPEVG
jgi:4-diphosphocytidyl-2-C-methyl-D-erythritol kinase